MREIKFRAWDNTESEWVDIKYLRFEFNDFWYLQAQDEHENEIDPPYFSGDEDFVLMQYTALKDKNGVEIYEGDVVRDKEGQTYTVAYDDEFAAFILVWVSNDERFETFEPMRELTVIGNIYEHPHLLEVSE